MQRNAYLLVRQYGAQRLSAINFYFDERVFGSITHCIGKQLLRNQVARQSTGQGAIHLVSYLVNDTVYDMTPDIMTSFFDLTTRHTNTNVHNYEAR